RHVVRGFDLSNREKREDLRRRLAGALLLVDARLGGLRGGLLDAASTVAPDVSEIEGDPRPVPFRIRHLTKDESQATPNGWRTEARIPVQNDDDEETAWLVIESLLAEPAESEEGRSTGANRAQKLEEHECWTEDGAATIAASLGLPEPYAEVLKVAARLHD